MQINLLRLKIFRSILHAGLNRQSHPEEVVKDLHLLNTLFEGVKASKHRNFHKNNSKNFFGVQNGARSSVARQDEIKRQGLWPHSCPLGYTKTNGDAMIVNESAELVRSAFRIYIQSKRKSTVHKALRRDHGVTLSKGNLSRMLKNELYAGVITLTNGEKVEGKHQTIIHPQLFTQAQTISNNIRRPTPDRRHANMNFPLTGFVRDYDHHKYYCYRKGGYALVDGSNLEDRNVFHNLFIPFLTEELANADINFVLEASSIGWKRMEKSIIRKNELLRHELASNSLTHDIINLTIGWKFFECKTNFASFASEMFCMGAQHWQQRSYDFRRELQFTLYPKGLLFDRTTRTFVADHRSLVKTLNLRQ